MPGIVITPGSFNPPAPAVQVMGVAGFPRTPVQTIRKWPQHSSRWAGEAPAPPELPAVDIQRDWFTGGCLVRTVGELMDEGAANVTLSGNRYVANGSYATTPNPSGYPFSVAAWSRPQESIDLGTFEIPSYFVTGESGSWGIPVMRLPYSVGLAAAADGATYEVRLSRAGSPDLIGTAGNVDLGLLSGGGPFEYDYTLDIQLWRNGAVCDRVRIGLKIIGSYTVADPVGTVGSIAEAITYVDPPDGLPEVLYGGQAIVPTITGPSLPIMSYWRNSIGQGGTVTPS